MLPWKNTIWLVKNSQMPSFDQSECILSAWCHLALPTFVYGIGNGCVDTCKGNIIKHNAAYGLISTYLDCRIPSGTGAGGWSGWAKRCATSRRGSMKSCWSSLYLTRRLWHWPVYLSALSILHTWVRILLALMLTFFKINFQCYK